MTRSEHVEWCKERALEYVNSGDLEQAYASMISDLTKHEETVKHPAKELGTCLMMTGRLNTADEMRKFINGFN